MHFRKSFLLLVLNFFFIYFGDTRDIDLVNVLLLDLFFKYIYIYCQMWMWTRKKERDREIERQECEGREWKKEKACLMYRIVPHLNKYHAIEDIAIISMCVCRCFNVMTLYPILIIFICAYVCFLILFRFFFSVFFYRRVLRVHTVMSKGKFFNLATVEWNCCQREIQQRVTIIN